MSPGGDRERPKIAPRPLQDRPRMAQERPKTSQDVSKIALRTTKKAKSTPRPTQEQPRPPQDRPRAILPHFLERKRPQEALRKIRQPLLSGSGEPLSLPQTPSLCSFTPPDLPYNVHLVNSLPVIRQPPAGRDPEPSLPQTPSLLIQKSLKKNPPAL